MNDTNISIDEIDRQIQELNKQRRKLTVVNSPREVEITAVMATYNAWMWLARSIFSLEMGAQSLPVDLIICDNASTDPTGDILAGEGFKNWMKKRPGINEVEILDPAPQIEMMEFGTPDHPIQRPFKNSTARKMHNIDFMMTKLTKHVQTPFIFYLDADVGAPSGCLAAMLQKMKERPNLAMLGIRYTWHSNMDHIQLGCNLARTDVMKKIVDQFDSRQRGCPCRDATMKLKEAGYEVEHFEGWVARHFKHENP